MEIGSRLFNSAIPQLDGSHDRSEEITPFSLCFYARTDHRLIERIADADDAAFASALCGSKRATEPTF